MIGQLPPASTPYTTLSFIPTRRDLPTNPNNKEKTSKAPSTIFIFLTTKSLALSSSTNMNLGRNKRVINLMLRMSYKSSIKYRRSLIMERFRYHRLKSTLKPHSKTTYPIRAKEVKILLLTREGIVRSLNNTLWPRGLVK